MKKKSLKLNAFLNAFRNILNLLFPLVTFPYVSRVLQADGIGKYNFANSIVSYFMLIAALGIVNYSVREGAKLRDDREKFSQFASQVFSINIISTLVAYILLFIAIIIFKDLRNYEEAIFIFSLQIFFITLGVEWIYTIFEEYAYITIRSIVFKIISIILLFSFVKRSNDYLNYVAITVFASVGSNVLNFVHSKQLCDIKLTLKFDFKKHFKPIFIIFATGIATQIYVNSDVTILGILKNDYSVGIYSVSSKIYNIVKTLAQALVIVTVPRLSMLLGKGKVEEFNTLLRRVTNILAMVTLPATVGLYMLAPQIITIISGSGFLTGVNSLRLLCPALLVSVFSWILAYCILLPAKRESKFFIAAVASAIVNIVLNFILIPFLSENGAALTTSIAEVLMLILIIYYSRDILRGVYLKEFWKDILTYLLGTVTVGLVCVIVSGWSKSLIIQLILAVGISIVVYGLLLIVFKNQFCIEIMKKIKGDN
ncbi:flippase [Streptococcus equinus]|uniref:flippase n=1 Tax=Streptococcus equinus TaxID=1335 RepID=UPI0011451931|nr:flippase [Streptococcus equinus]UVF03453.1 flippase [Streptococcus equinus]GEB10127.1 flippase [Streptococcus equinus]